MRNTILLLSIGIIIGISAQSGFRKIMQYNNSRNDTVAIKRELADNINKMVRDLASKNIVDTVPVEKYYWLVGYNKGCGEIKQYAANYHPFLCAPKTGIYTIVNWKEITKEEYEMFQTLIKNQSK